MHKPLLVISLVLAALSCGCTSAPQTSSSAAESSATPESTIAATPAPTEVPALALEPADHAVLPYDEIRAIALDSAPYFKQAAGYYTMCQDGQWGLLRSDGTEVMPCQFSQPVTRCASLDLRWHAPEALDRLDSLSAQLQATGDGRMCSGEHDGNFSYWYYDIDTAKVQAYGGFSMGSVRALDSSDLAYGTYLPCRFGTFVDGQGDPDYYRATEPVTMVYADGDGSLLNDEQYEAAGCFYDQPLAPARQNGHWLYLNTAGQAVTEAIYDATYAAQDQEGYASPLLNGYAPVCREGRWGLLDSTGAEVLPCTYAGVAWDGGLLWLRQDDGWHAYTIPGVVVPTPTPDPLAELPANITPPDTRYPEQAAVQFRTIADDNVILRAGPGTEYDRVGTLPPDTEVQSLGCNESIFNWTLVRYQGQFGWACTDYMTLTEYPS